jgi:hypothetical protein
VREIERERERKRRKRYGTRRSQKIYNDIITKYGIYVLFYQHKNTKGETSSNYET